MRKVDPARRLDRLLSIERRTDRGGGQVMGRSPIRPARSTAAKLAAALAAIALLQAADAATTAGFIGRIVDIHGNPVADATVVVTGPSGETLAESVSDEQGIFRIDAAAWRDRNPRVRVLRVGFAPFEAPLAELTGERRTIVIEPAPFREQVAVTAARREKRQFETTESVSVVTASDMRAAVVTSAPAALEGSTGVQIQRTNLGGGSPYLRGLIGNRVLLLVDGVRVNNSTFRLGPNQYLNSVDPLGLERIEVVRGPASSLYGSDGLGGVVNLFSAEPDGISGGHLAIGYDSATSAPLASLRLEGMRGPWSATGGVSVVDFDDLEGGADTGIQSPTGYRQRAADVKLRLRLPGGDRLTLVGQYLEASDVPRYDRIAAGRDDIHLFDPQRRTLGFVRWERDRSTARRPGLAVTLSRMEQLEGRRIRRRDATSETSERDVVITDGLGVQLTWPAAGRVEWVAGAEFYRDAVSSSRSDRELSTGEVTLRRPRFPDGSSFSSSAVYGQANVRIAPRLELSLGARYSVFDTRAWLVELGEPYASRLDDLNASAGLLARVSDSVHLTGSVARGFRAPGLDDATVFGEFNAGIEVPNPDLSPETVVNTELGLRVSRSRSWFSATVFDSELNDLIDRAPGTFRGSATYLGEAVYQRQNIHNAEITGFELEARTHLRERLTISASFSGTRGDDAISGAPLTRIPPLAGRLAASWLTRTGRQSVDVIADIAARQDRLSPVDIADSRIPVDGTPGYVVLSAQVGLEARGGWQLNVVLHNLTDETYRVHGSGIDGPGRSLRLLITRGFRWEAR